MYVGLNTRMNNHKRINIRLSVHVRRRDPIYLAGDIIHEELICRRSRVK